MNRHFILPWTIGGSWVYPTYTAAALQNVTSYPYAPDDINGRSFRIFAAGDAPIGTEELIDLVTKTYGDRPNRKQYSSILVGPPNGGIVHLAAGFRCPYLPSDIFLPIEIACDPDSLECHIEAARSISRRFVQKTEQVEITMHFDPIHDRVDIGRILHSRLKFLSLPQSYQKFIGDNLREGGTVVAFQIDLDWKQLEIADQLFFQLGGFGGIPYEEYVSGSARLDRWLETQHWTSHRGGWGNAGYQIWPKPESEWGSLPSFTNSVKEFCDRNGYGFQAIILDNPFKVGMMASLMQMEDMANSRPLEFVTIEAYWTMNPNFALSSNCLPIWIPYVDNVSFSDCKLYLEHVFRFLESRAPHKIVLGYPWVLPTFDLKSPREWLEMLSSYARREDISLPGVADLDNPLTANTKQYIDITNRWRDVVLGGAEKHFSIAGLKKAYEKVTTNTLVKQLSYTSYG